MTDNNSHKDQGQQKQQQQQSQSSLGSTGQMSEEASEISANPSIPPTQKSAFVQFLTQIGSFTGDLSLLTAPAFLLNGVSMLEYSVHWCDFPDIMSECWHFPAKSAPASEQDQFALERMKRVVKYYLSTTYGSYHERCEKGSEKKPYNPILGEQFYCHWDNDRPEVKSGDKWNSVDMIVEQVSHHPPIGAFYGQMDRSMSIKGFCAQKSKFKSMTLKVEQIGNAVLTLYDQHSDSMDVLEEYVIDPLPDLQIRGLLSGSIFLELGKSTFIKCAQTGYTCRFDWLPKPWFSGGYHHLDGKIYKESNPSEVFYQLSGKWVEQVTIQKSGEQESQPFFNFKSNYGDATKDGNPRLYVPKQIPEAHLDPEKDSKLIWKSTTEALNKGDFSSASSQKSKLEDDQRKIRKEREARGEEWEPEWFRYVHADGTTSSSENLITGKQTVDAKQSNNVLYPTRDHSKDSLSSKVSKASSGSVSKKSTSSKKQHGKDGSDGGSWVFKRELLQKLKSKSFLIVSNNK
ncbi:hypothetical protein MP228_010941 [Amoeboaphelidium protococcarum]|nr:hypothetical protein MP228_010941 [Amoeboaphelidium protococcarum]